MLGLRLKYDLKSLFRLVWPLYVVGIALPIGIRVLAGFKICRSLIRLSLR